MPKSKAHQKRRVKKCRDHEKLVKWATRKVEDMTAKIDALPPEEREPRWSFGSWRKKVKEEEVDS